jgi:hypothetical protein
MILTWKSITFVFSLAEAIVISLGILHVGQTLPIPAHILLPIFLTIAILYFPALYLVRKGGQ